MGSGAVTSTYRVIYGDTDQMGVVYYANYLRLFEIGRNEWIRGSGLPYTRFEERGLMLPVVHASVDYRQSAKYDDLLAIEAAVVEVGRASVRFEYSVRRDGMLLASGTTKHALLGKDGRLKPWPADLFEHLDGYRSRLLEET
jgi:acyl-CoA thioester hydrolase